MKKDKVRDFKLTVKACLTNDHCYQIYMASYYI